MMLANEYIHIFLEVFIVMTSLSLQLVPWCWLVCSTPHASGGDVKRRKQVRLCVLQHAETMVIQKKMCIESYCALVARCTQTGQCTVLLLICSG